MAGPLHSLPSSPAQSKPPPPDRLTAFLSAPTLLKALPPTRLAAFLLVPGTMKTPMRHRLTAFLPAGALSKTKTPPRYGLTALKSAPALSETKIPPPHLYTAFPPAPDLSKTSPPTRLVVFLSATSLLLTTSPNRLSAPRKPSWSLALLPVWLAGHPSSPYHPPRASSCHGKPDILPDPKSFRRCTWNSLYSCEQRICPSAPGYGRFKTISPVPPTYS